MRSSMTGPGRPEARSPYPWARGLRLAGRTIPALATAVPAPLPTLDPNPPDDVASYVVGSMTGGAGGRGAE